MNYKWANFISTIFKYEELNWNLHRNTTLVTSKSEVFGGKKRIPAKTEWQCVERNVPRMERFVKVTV